MILHRRFAFLVMTVVLASCALQGAKGPSEAVQRATALGPQCNFDEGPNQGLILVGQLIVDQSTSILGAMYANNGTIVAIGTETEIETKYPGVTTIKCAGAYLSPGFINPHEHTSYSYGFPDPATSPIYGHRDEWRRGLNGKHKIVQPSPTNDDKLLAWIELRHLLAGVTTIAGSGAIPGMVKNVASRNAPVYRYQVDLATFPFGPKAMTEFEKYACDPNQSTPPLPAFDGNVPSTLAYVGHVGEGTNCEAKLELTFFLRYVGAHGGRKYTVIHGVALDSGHLATLKAANVSVVWSPRSNLALYGKTVDGAWLTDNGVSVALGTDWSPSGSYNVFEEMRCAQDHAKKRSTRALTGPELWSMVTGNGAESLGLAPAMGTLAVGKAADVVILNDKTGRGLADFGALTEDDVIAVVVDGKLQVANSRYVSGSRLLAQCPNAIGTKSVCVDFSPYGFTFAQMQGANAGSVDVVGTKKQVGCSP